MLNLGRDYINKNIFSYDCECNDLTVSRLTDGTPYVYIDIEPTATLESEVDRIRSGQGFIPFFEYENDNIDLDGYYEFSMSLTRDRCLELIAFVRNTTSDDGESWYDIPLNEHDKEYMYERIKGIVGNEEWNEVFDAFDKEKEN